MACLLLHPTPNVHPNARSAFSDFPADQPNFTWTFDGWVTSYPCDYDAGFWNCNFSKYGYHFLETPTPISLKMTPSFDVGVWIARLTFAANNYRSAEVYLNASFIGTLTATSESVLANQYEAVVVPVVVVPDSYTIGEDKFLMHAGMTDTNVVPYFQLNSSAATSRSCALNNASSYWICDTAGIDVNLRYQPNVELPFDIYFTPSISYAGPQTHMSITVKGLYFDELVHPLNITVMASMDAVVLSAPPTCIAGQYCSFTLQVNATAMSVGGEAVQVLSSAADAVRFRTPANFSYVDCLSAGTFTRCDLSAQAVRYSPAEQLVTLEIVPLSTMLGGWATTIMVSADYMQAPVHIPLNATIVGLLTGYATGNQTSNLGSITTDSMGTHVMQGDWAGVMFHIAGSASSSNGGDFLTIPTNNVYWNGSEWWIPRFGRCCPANCTERTAWDGTDQQGAPGEGENSTRQQKCAK